MSGNCQLQGQEPQLMGCLMGYSLVRDSVLDLSGTSETLMGSPHQEAGLYITRKREGSARCQDGLRGRTGWSIFRHTHRIELARTLCRNQPIPQHTHTQATMPHAQKLAIQAAVLTSCWCRTGLDTHLDQLFYCALFLFPGTWKIITGTSGLSSVVTVVTRS